METLEDADDNLEDGKGYQLRVRISGEDKDGLEKLVALRGNTNISRLVREALALLLDTKGPSTVNEQKISDLATLLKREPQQVEAACIQGILDLIENKSKVPLIVMEVKLYQSYTNQ